MLGEWVILFPDQQVVLTPAPLCLTRFEAPGVLRLHSGARAGHALGPLECAVPPGKASELKANGFGGLKVPLVGRFCCLLRGFS